MLKAPSISISLFNFKPLKSNLARFIQSLNIFFIDFNLLDLNSDKFKLIKLLQFSKALSITSIFLKSPLKFILSKFTQFKKAESILFIFSVFNLEKSIYVKFSQFSNKFDIEFNLFLKFISISIIPSFFEINLLLFILTLSSRFLSLFSFIDFIFME